MFKAGNYSLNKLRWTAICLENLLWSVRNSVGVKQTSSLRTVFPMLHLQWTKTVRTAARVSVHFKLIRTSKFEASFDCWPQYSLKRKTSERAWKMPKAARRLEVRRGSKSEVRRLRTPLIQTIEMYCSAIVLEHSKGFSVSLRIAYAMVWMASGHRNLAWMPSWIYTGIVQVAGIIVPLSVNSESAQSRNNPNTRSLNTRTPGEGLRSPFKRE